MPRPIIVTGPTGSGKSAFAVALAERLGGEIIGADAFQIYAGLPILTAQPPSELTQRIPHHLVGFLDIQTSFDAARFVDAAQIKIQEIQNRQKIPILAGGTGLYLKALTHGLANLPPIDPDLRAEIAKLPLDEAIRQLAERDPDASSQIDVKNPIRVTRALEIVISTGQPLAVTRNQWNHDNGAFRGIALVRNREDLRSRIAANVDAMFASGVMEEVRAAASAGETASKAIGFREIQSLLRGEISPTDCRDAIVLASQRYAKRQLTWCRTQFSFSSLNLTANPSPDAAMSLAMQFLGEL